VKAIWHQVDTEDKPSHVKKKDRTELYLDYTGRILFNTAEPGTSSEAFY